MLLLLVRLSLAVDVTEDSGQVVEAVDPREKSTVEHLVGQLAGGIEPSVRYPGRNVSVATQQGSRRVLYR